jgi:ABC-type amino acid transport substrate-binding protein
MTRTVFTPMIRFVTAALSLTLVTALPGSAEAQNTLEKIKRTGVMSSANSFEYVPFGYVEGGKTVGFDVDLGEEIARRMGVRMTWEKIDFRGIVAALTSGRVDTLVTAMTWTPERAERILFSEPYFDGGIGAAYRLEAPISKPDDIKGRNVGLQIGSAGDKWARDNYGTTFKSLKTYDTLLLALKDLEAGRVDIVVSSLPSVRYNVRRLKGLGMTGSWDTRDVGINTRKEDADLMAEINKHMHALKAEGYFEKLTDKWF